MGDLQLDAARLLVARLNRFLELHRQDAPDVLIAKEQVLIADSIARWMLAGAGLEPDPRVPEPLPPEEEAIVRRLVEEMEAAEPSYGRFTEFGGRGSWARGGNDEA